MMNSATRWGWWLKGTCAHVGSEAKMRSPSVAKPVNVGQIKARECSNFVHLCLLNQHGNQKPSITFCKRFSHVSLPEYKFTSCSRDIKQLESFLWSCTRKTSRLDSLPTSALHYTRIHPQYAHESRLNIPFHLHKVSCTSYLRFLTLLLLGVARAPPLPSGGRNPKNDLHNRMCPNSGALLKWPSAALKMPLGLKLSSEKRQGTLTSYHAVCQRKQI